MPPALTSPSRGQERIAGKPQKYFIQQQQEELTIKCSRCGRAGIFAVARLRQSNHSIRINCPCARSFAVELEFRRDYRTKTRIAGTFRALTTPRTRARQCLIVDHSSGGLLLAIDEPVPIKQEDQLIVCYRPDPQSPQEIERVITVRHYQKGARIGGAFLEPLSATARTTGVPH